MKGAKEQYFNDLVQDCNISNALAMKVLQFFY